MKRERTVACARFPREVMVRFGVLMPEPSALHPCGDKQGSFSIQNTCENHFEFSGNRSEQLFKLCMRRSGFRKVKQDGTMKRWHCLTDPEGDVTAHDYRRSSGAAGAVPSHDAQALPV